MARRGNKNIPKTVLNSTATKIVIRPMNWNQYRVGTLLQRVHTDCLGRKFSPQRSQYTAALPGARMQPRHRRQLIAFMFPKTTGQRVSFGIGLICCTKVCLREEAGWRAFFELPRSVSPVCFGVRSIIVIRVGWLRATRASLWGIADYGNAGAFHALQIVFGIDLAFWRIRLLGLGFACGLRE